MKGSVQKAKIAAIVAAIAAMGTVRPEAKAHLQVPEKPYLS